MAAARPPRAHRPVRRCLAVEPSQRLRARLDAYGRFVLLVRPEPDGWLYASTGLNVGLNLSLAIIQKPMTYVVIEKLLSARFSHEAVKRVVRVQVKPRHRAVRSDVVDARTLEGASPRARNVELSQHAVLIAHEPVVHI